MLLTKDQLVILQHAHRKIGELGENKDLFSSSSLKISFNEKDGLSDSLNSPSDIVIKAAVSDIRQFWMSNSDIQFNKLYKIIAPHLNSDDLTKLKLFKAAWHKTSETSDGNVKDIFQLILNEESIGNFTLIDYMINGDIMHVEKDKAKKIALMRGTPILGFAKITFTSLLQSMANILFALDHEFISAILRNTELKS